MAKLKPYIYCSDVLSRSDPKHPYSNALSKGAAGSYKRALQKTIFKIKQIYLVSKTKNFFKILFINS